MRFGIFCFIILFLGTEFVQWLGHISWIGELPLPVTLLAGVALAIASNLPKQTASSVTQHSATTTPAASQTLTEPHSTPDQAPFSVTPQAPTIAISAKDHPLSNKGTISFKIRRPFQP